MHRWTIASYDNLEFSKENMHNIHDQLIPKAYTEYQMWVSAIPQLNRTIIFQKESLKPSNIVTLDHQVCMHI